MKVFTATNGILFTITEDGVLRWEGGYDPRRVTDALREYFQRERDTQLGRWRDPENPNIVVYPIPDMNDQGDGYGRAVWVLDEAEMVSRTVLDDRHSHSSASHYFAAHPDEETHKPWHEAKPGEIWEIGLLELGPSACLVTEGDFVEISKRFEVAIGSSLIESGRRIWPTDAEGDGDE